MYQVLFLETFFVSNSAELFGQVRKHLETQTQDSYNRISLSDKVFWFTILEIFLRRQRQFGKLTKNNFQ